MKLPNNDIEHWETRDFLKALLLNFQPWRKSPWKLKFHVYYAPVLKVIACIMLYTGLFKTVSWYFDTRRLDQMAQRYVHVANRLYYEENNPDVALTFLDKAIKLRDGNAEFRFMRAYIAGLSATRFLFNLGRPLTRPELDRAHAALAEAVFLENFEPNRPEAYLLEAQILMGLKEYDRAEASLLKALRLRPDSAFAHIRLATLRLMRNSVDGAAEALAEAERLDPNSKWVWLWKGVLDNDYRKDPVAARACYEKALALDPKFDMAMYNMGWTYARGKEKDYVKARDLMLRALRVNPGYKEACYALGMLYGLEDNYRVSKIWLSKAIAMDGSFLEALKYRGVVNGEMSDWKAAIADFDAAIALDPMNADLFVRRAKMYQKLHAYNAALDDLRFAHELDPRAKRTLYYLGNVYADAGDVESALRWYDQALVVDASYAEAHAAKAEALLATGKKGQALACFDSAITCANYKPGRFWLQKGLALERTGEPKPAVDCFEKACGLDAKLAQAWLALGRVRKAIGDVAGAAAAFRAYLLLVPGDEKARETLVALVKGGV